MSWFGLAVVEGIYFTFFPQCRCCLLLLLRLRRFLLVMSTTSALLYSIPFNVVVVVVVLLYANEYLSLRSVCVCVRAFM